MRLKEFLSAHFHTIIAMLLCVVGVIFTLFLFQNRLEYQKDSLRKRALSLSLAFSLDTTHFSSLTVDEFDLSSQEYLHLKSKFLQLVFANDDVQFMYILKKLNGSAVYVVDSESVKSRSYVIPGRSYERTNTELLKVFDDETTLLTNTRDSRGDWFSVYVPIELFKSHDLEHNISQAPLILGFDVPLRSFYLTALLGSLIPAILGIFSGIIFYLLALSYIQQTENSKLRAEYLSIAAHDLRTPITGINWLSSILLRKLPDNMREARDYIKQIQAAGENLLTTLNDLLNASSLISGRHNELRFEVVKVSEIITDCLTPLSLSLQEKDMKITYSDNWEQMPFILADRDKIKRVFINILSNSIKYGTMHAPIHLRCLVEKDDVTFSVTDQGIGIPKNELSKVFSGYYRATNATTQVTHGTGLGLYYVKGMVALHKGEVWIESELGHGTTVFLKFPKVD